MAIIYESVSAIAVLAATVLISYSFYAIYLHPLGDYPGPWLSAITRIPYWIVCIKGDQVRHLTKLHRKYGPVVRFAPNDLSYADGQAWRDINSVQKGKKENRKEAKFHRPPSNGTASLIVQNDPIRHDAVRRVFSPAFAEKAMKAQEPMFQKYADLMVRNGREVGSTNMAELFNFATFDIMAELAFGESLGLLEQGAYSSWVATIFDTIKILPLMQMVEFYPILKWFYDILEPKSIIALRSNHFDHTVVRVNKRLEQGSDKPDLWNLVVESDVLTLDEMHINAELFMAAGTETTASLLSGLIYYLLANPDKMKALTDEIRNRFDSSEDITFEVLARLEYLNACIREGLRVYPPVPSGIPREIAEGGNTILGKWLPEGTRVSVHQTATYRSPANFRNPDKFAPERWLGDPEYKDDNREAHQPFSTGPRNCLGMNMAWHEVRLLLSKVLYNFDLESDVGPDWLDQKVYVLWGRKPLVCKLIPAAQK